MKLFLFVLLFFTLSATLYSQVTIGSGEEPVKFGLLELKEFNSANPGDKTADNGGLVLPKVVLVEKYQLLPFYTGDTTNMIYKTVTKLDHRGLVVYNLVEDEAKELCKGINFWDGYKWNCIQEKEGAAIIDIEDCRNISFKGDYITLTELNGSNYLEVKGSVKKAGTYTITAAPKDDNGYYFSITDVALSKGSFTFLIPGRGEPNTPGIDDIEIRINGKVIDCTQQITVKDGSIRPKYSMICSQTKVNGLYYSDVAVEASNTITMVLNVDPTSFGSSYSLKTNEVDGLSFEGSGVITSSPQTVTLFSKGTPRGVNKKTFTITSNSESDNASCIANVRIVIPPKRILSLSINNTFGYGLQDGDPWAMINDTKNFGPLDGSIVPFAGLGTKKKVITSTFTDDGSMFYACGPTALKASFLQQLLTTGVNGQSRFEIVIIGYNYTIDAETASIIADFLNNGGIVLAYCENKGYNEYLLRAVFNDQNITISGSNPAGSMYRYKEMTDPILQGPFGNLTGLTWGEDASATLWAENLPMDEITLYTSNKAMNDSKDEILGAATCFRHNTLPFVWVGDGGFNSSNSGASNIICPFRLTSKTINGVTYSNWPSWKKYGASGNGYPAGAFQSYNALFTANAFAWCLNKAEELRKQKIGQ